MATNLVPLDKFELGQLPAIYRNRSVAADYEALTAGLTGSFAVLSFRSKVWRIRHQKTETAILDKNGDPRPRLLLHILGASPALSKKYYEDAYDGADAIMPDCFSLDGVRPDPQSPDIQSPLCHTCPHNVFGTARNADGSPGKGKRCSDRRRLAVTQAGNPRNERFDGPMLLEVPPTSLRELRELGNQLRENHVPLAAAVIEVTFDRDVDHPKPLFNLTGVVTDDDHAAVVMEMLDHPNVSDIITNVNAPPPPPVQDAGPEAQPEPEPEKPKTKRGGTRKKVEAKPAPPADDSGMEDIDGFADGPEEQEEKPKPTRGRPKGSTNKKKPTERAAEAKKDEAKPEPEDAEFSDAQDFSDGDDDEFGDDGGGQTSDDEDDLLAGLDF